MQLQQLIPSEKVAPSITVLMLERGATRQNEIVNFRYAYRLAVDFLTAVGAVLGGGDPVFLKLLVDELRGAAAVALIHV